MDTLKKLFILFLFSLSALGANSVAKVIQVKGKVYNVDTKKKIKKGQWLPEGATILTKSKSFVKLLFIDKSKMSLGPKSKMMIAKFPKKEAGVISLLKGQLRSKVTKNYMDMKNKEKSKLFIKTKTAAMGVRGTDFQVNFNPLNQNTSLITFEGRVAMNALKKEFSRAISQNELENVVSAPSAVMVTQGQYSGVLPGVNLKPLVPVKVNKKQLKSLEENDGSKFEEAANKKNKKKKKVAMRSILPPGVKNSEFAGAAEKEVIKEIAKVDKKAALALQNEVQRAPSSKNLTGNNIDDLPNDRLKMSDGGFVDTNNGLYIPPPKDAAIDPMTNEVIMPVVMGGFNPKTGNYENEFFNVNENGEFIAKKDNPINQQNKERRGPASVNEDGEKDSPPLASAQGMPKNVNDMMKESMKENFFEAQEVEFGRDPANFDPNVGAFGPGPGGEYPEFADGDFDNVVEDAIDSAREDAQDKMDEQIEDAIRNSAKVRFNIICSGCK